jgi:hypothetical protein
VIAGVVTTAGAAVIAGVVTTAGAGPAIDRARDERRCGRGARAAG